VNASTTKTKVQRQEIENVSVRQNSDEDPRKLEPNQSDVLRTEDRNDPKQ